jgi:hypothetical protein
MFLIFHAVCNLKDGENAAIELLKIKSATQSPRMRISACFTECKALQSYYKKSGYQYMENIALHFLPVFVSRRFRPPAFAGVVAAVAGLEVAAVGAVVAVVAAVAAVAAVATVATVVVVAVVELGSSPQLTTVTT